MWLFNIYTLFIRWQQQQSWFDKSADCMRKFSANLNKYSKEITNYEKKKMVQFRDEEIQFYKNHKFCDVDRNDKSLIPKISWRC